MRVLPHPHTGLQTVTWPVAGRDPAPGQRRVRGRRPARAAQPHDGRARGLALRVLARRTSRCCTRCSCGWRCPTGWPTARPAFEQVERPARLGGAAGAGDGVRRASSTVPGRRRACTRRCSAPSSSSTPGADVEVPLVPGFEHAVLVLGGAAEVAGTPHTTSGLLYLGDGRDHVRVRSHDGARLLLLGGAPFAHDLVMWWNFVGRTHADIAQARADWESDDRADALRGGRRPRRCAHPRPRAAQHPPPAAPPAPPHPEGEPVTDLSHLPDPLPPGGRRARRRRAWSAASSRCPTPPAPPPRPRPRWASRSARSPTAWSSGPTSDRCWS